MNLIVAVDKNWAIGNKGKLLVSIPSDMKFFREETSGEGKVVILGRKTLETFPGGRPLPKRLNVILTKNPDFKVDGAVVVHSVEEALEAVKDYADEKIYVIVTRGEKPASGYSADIRKMKLETDKNKETLIVYATFRDPSKNSSMSQVLTYPVKVAETELKKLPDEIELRVQYEE